VKLLGFLGWNRSDVLERLKAGLTETEEDILCFVVVALLRLGEPPKENYWDILLSAQNHRDEFVRCCLYLMCA